MLLENDAAFVAATFYREFGGLVHSGGGSSALDSRRLAENGGCSQPESLGGRSVDNFNRLHGNLSFLGSLGSLRGGHVHSPHSHHGRGGVIFFKEVDSNDRARKN